MTDGLSRLLKIATVSLQNVNSCTEKPHEPTKRAYLAELCDARIGLPNGIRIFEIDFDSDNPHSEYSKDNPDNVTKSQVANLDYSPDLSRTFHNSSFTSHHRQCLFTRRYQKALI